MVIYYDYVLYESVSFLVAVSDKGLLYVGLREESLVQLQSLLEKKEVKINYRKSPAKTANYTQQLKEYFTGQRNVFELALDFSLFGTVFQRAVWQQLLKVPYGEVSTYSDLAARIERPKANQAVGTAVGNNPIPIIVPCHRIIRKDGTIGGFSGGLALKRLLMKIEGIEGIV